MAIVFFCQSCGARFEVPDASAGKKGRCRKCGQHIEIPRRENLASMMAIPVLATAGAAPAPRPAPALDAKSLQWLRAAATNVGLAPVSGDGLPAARRGAVRPSALDDLGDSKPYRVAAAPKVRGGGGVSSGPAGAGLMFWRRGMGEVQALFRRINELAYFLSVPFIVVLLLGIVLKSRSTALFGATFVVILNVARIAAGVVNLAAVPLRDGLNPGRLKKPAKRVVEPVVTIALVVLAFTFVPWLSSERFAGGNVAERIKSAAKNLGREIKGEAKATLEKAENLDLEKLGAEAKRSLRTIGTGPEGGAPSGAGGPSAKRAVGDLIQGVGERARGIVSEAIDQP